MIDYSRRNHQEYTMHPLIVSEKPNVALFTIMGRKDKISKINKQKERKEKYKMSMLKRN